MQFDYTHPDTQSRRAASGRFTDGQQPTTDR
jgi:hypothetical protein